VEIARRGPWLAAQRARGPPESTGVPPPTTHNPQGGYDEFVRNREEKAVPDACDWSRRRCGYHVVADRSPVEGTRSRVLRRACGNGLPRIPGCAGQRLPDPGGWLRPGC